MIDLIKQIINSKCFCAVIGTVVVFIMIVPELFKGIRDNTGEEKEDD